MSWAAVCYVTASSAIAYQFAAMDTLSYWAAAEAYMGLVASLLSDDSKPVDYQASSTIVLSL